MVKKMSSITFLLFAVFAYSDGIFVVGPNADEGYGLAQEVRGIYAGPQNQRISQEFSTHKKLIQDSRNKDFEALEKELDKLVEEMKKLEKEAREKVLKEILPRLKEEMKKLREKLRKWQDEEDESEPIHVKAIEI
jgi:hypothetical protein